MIWKWPTADNLSYYKQLASTKIFEATTVLAKVNSEVFRVSVIEFSYQITIETLYHNLRFELRLVSATNRGDETIGLLMDFSMAQKVAELHAAQNFVNPQLSQ